MNNLTKSQAKEAAQIAGEMAASRLFSLLHERLDELRERDQVTVADIASRIGLSEQQVSRWLNAPRNMTVKSAGRLLAAMEAQLLFELDRHEDIATHNMPLATPIPMQVRMMLALPVSTTEPPTSKYLPSAIRTSTKVSGSHEY